MAMQAQVQTRTRKGNNGPHPHPRTQTATSPRFPDEWIDKEIKETHRSLIGYLPQYGDASEKNVLEHESLLYVTYVTTKFIRMNKVTGQTTSAHRLPKLEIQGFDLEMNNYKKEAVQKAIQSFQKAGANVQKPDSGQRTALYSSYHFDANGRVLNGGMNVQALANLSPTEHKACNLLSIISGHDHGDSFSNALLTDNSIDENRFIKLRLSSSKKEVEHYFNESGKMYSSYEIEGMRRKALEEKYRKEAEKYQQQIQEAIDRSRRKSETVDTQVSGQTDEAKKSSNANRGSQSTPPTTLATVDTKKKDNSAQPVSEQNKRSTASGKGINTSEGLRPSADNSHRAQTTAENVEYKKQWQSFSKDIAAKNNLLYEETSNSNIFSAKLKSKTDNSYTQISASSANNLALTAVDKDGKKTVPDLKIFEALAEKAKKEGEPIKFGNIKDADFKAKLMIACLAKNVEMINQPELSQEFLASLSPTISVRLRAEFNRAQSIRSQTAHTTQERDSGDTPQASTSLPMLFLNKESHRR